jgi:hypothetical protein
VIQRLARRAEDRLATTSQPCGALPTRSARRVDGDAMSGDRIENGHEQSSPVGTRLMPCVQFWLRSIEGVVTRQLLHRDDHIPRADRGGQSASDCSGVEGWSEFQRISQSMVAAV